MLFLNDMLHASLLIPFVFPIGNLFNGIFYLFAYRHRQHILFKQAVET